MCCAVSVGKTEYQSVGREDFSFPVTSIRENLVIMLCDSEGNLVTKQEVKTISVAEKGDAEINFALKYRGNIKLRLTFVLNEKEKEKIRELRSSVFKRKHEELIKGTNDICSPGTSLQLASKDSSNLSYQKMPKISTDSNLNKIEHGPPSITKAKKETSFLIVSQPVDDLTGAGNNRSVPNRTRSDNIKKMISAFESNAKQNSGSQISPRTRTRVNKIDSHTSIESMSYENEDIKHRRISQTLIRRSFSAGDLTDAILQNDPNFAQKPRFNETSASDESVGVNTENRETNLLQRSVIRNQHKEGGLSNEAFEGTLISVSDERSVEVHTENRETNSLQESVIRHQHKDGLSNKVFDGYIFHAASHYRDYEVSRCINELSCIDRTSYFEISDTLMPHRLCLTSAPKKVRNFLENFITRSHNEKIKLHGVAFDEVQEEIGSRSQTEDPHCQKVGSSILNGWLIEQGARIFIVIVACGTIILNTR
ncbi:hypothetical protein FCM35_KLT10698 [Carex littledalei]|uniref:Uncharacterized protein n=1 Tax=Carex littledalei TaxID=544730 RepID=A0A833QMB7_9POAL|nr:hypothetical protein FCM35_KLT10698 [Carex littledalei]